MDLNKVINLCKKAKRFVVFRQNAKTQWLGDDVAAYLITGEPKFTPEYLTASAGLKPQDVENTIFKNSNFPDALDSSDNTDDEILVGISDITINFEDGEYTPVFTTKGVRFVKTLYFNPFSNDDYEIFTRETEDGVLYFVVKIGMFVSAIIIAEDNHLDTSDVMQISKIAAEMSVAHSNLNQEDE